MDPFHICADATVSVCMVWTGLRIRNDELCERLDAAVADAETAAADRRELQAALDEAKERAAKSEAEAAELAKQSAIDAAALESLEYLHGVVPSQAHAESSGGLVAPEQGREAASDLGEKEVKRLQSELTEALTLSESREAELIAVQSELRAAEEKYSELVASHAAVRTNDYNYNLHSQST